jgi:hypothetical protein
MRLFRRARDTKTSVIRREGVSASAEAAAMPFPNGTAPSPVACVVAQPSAPSQPRFDAAESDAFLEIPPAPSSYDGRSFQNGYDTLEDSDVFLCETPAEPQAPREVTLFVHGWHQVEPGLLSWTFPSLRAALDAVRRMKNAIGWCVVSGTSWRDLESARAGGAVLVEQLT